MPFEPVSFAELEAALPQVLAAPKTDTPVLGLCLRPARGAREFPARIAMTPEGGIPGERWATEPWLRLADGRGHPGIQVSILGVRVMDLCWRDRQGTPHPGDPVVADLDCGEENLPVGSLIGLGTAVLKVSEVWNDGCAKWKVRYGTPAYDWVRDPARRHLRLRGVLCAVDRAGEVALGDKIRVLRRGEG